MLFSLLTRSIFFIVFFSLTPQISSSSKEIIFFDLKGMIFVDLDDTISRHDYISIREIIYLIPQAVACCNSSYDAARLTCAIPTLVRKGHEFAQKSDATTETVILNIIDYLKQNNYGDFTPIIAHITRLAANKKPIIPMITYLKQLSTEGYILIATTNQDAWGHIHYREKLKYNYGIDLSQLFQATLCCSSTLIAQHQKATCSIDNCFMIDTQQHIYMTNNIAMRKPYENYYCAAIAIAKKYCSAITPETSLLLIDDAPQNIDGFNKFIKDHKLRGQGIHFPKSSHRTNPHLKSDKNFINEIIKPIIQSFQVEKATL